MMPEQNGLLDFVVIGCDKERSARKGLQTNSDVANEKSSKVIRPQLPTVEISAGGVHRGRIDSIYLDL